MTQIGTFGEDLPKPCCYFKPAIKRSVFSFKFANLESMWIEFLKFPSFQLLFQSIIDVSKLTFERTFLVSYDDAECRMLNVVSKIGSNSKIANLSCSMKLTENSRFTWQTRGNSTCEDLEKSSVFKFPATSTDRQCWISTLQSSCNIT